MNQESGLKHGSLEPVIAEDSDSFYAAATIAQICSFINDPERSQELFKKAFENKKMEEALASTTEVRVRIHLLMVVAMCCMHGLGDKRKAKDYLDEARLLVGSLPNIRSEKCTVFSNLSKRNETATTIIDHIERIGNEELFI